VENARVADNKQMANTYQITRHEMADFVLTEVRGAAFCISDLYALAGRDQHHCEFGFREGSAAHATYGPTIAGTIVYSPIQRAALEGRGIHSVIERQGQLNIRCYDPSLSQSILDDLKWAGW
jgi:hypothetical protein